MTQKRLWAHRIFTLLGAFILFSLGTWQLKRLEWKKALIQKEELTWNLPCSENNDLEALKKANKLDDVPCVKITGHFLEPFCVDILGKVPHPKDKALFHFLHVSHVSVLGKKRVCLFETIKGQKIWIDRGWTPQSKKTIHQSIPKQVTQTISLDRSPPLNMSSFSMKWLFPHNNPDKGEWIDLDVKDLSSFFNVENTLPFYGETIDKTFSNQKVTFPRPRSHPRVMHNNHLTYAFIWYSLCACFILMFVYQDRKRD